MAYLCKRAVSVAARSNSVRIFLRLLHAYDGADTSDDELQVGKFGSFTIFRINRPEKRNCLNYATAVKLKEALTMFNEDNLSPIGILHGEGGNFCSGLDCNELANNVSFYKKFQDLKLMNEFSRKPIIAAVNGCAVGTGFDLALWCDLRVVEETAIFGYFNRRLGVPVAETSIMRLCSLVGKARAIDWVTTGRIIYPTEAFQTGIVSRLVACGTAYGQSVSLAKRIEKFPFSSLLSNRIDLHLDSYSLEEQAKMLIDKEKLAPSVEKRMAEGTKKFCDGLGRHGKFFAH